MTQLDFKDLFTKITIVSPGKKLAGTKTKVLSIRHFLHPYYLWKIPCLHCSFVLINTIQGDCRCESGDAFEGGLRTHKDCVWLSIFNVLSNSNDKNRKTKHNP